MSPMVRVGERVLKVSNLDKVLFSGDGTTKAEVLHYYAEVAPWILKQLRDRPVTRIRWPEGTAADSFFEKNLPSGAPSWLPRVELGATSRVTYPLVQDVATLTYLGNLASLELHTPQWRLQRDADGVMHPGNPDRMVIDLDPGSPADEHECAIVALAARAELRDLGLSAHVVTSGSKGIHLYAPLNGTYTSDQVSAIAGQLAALLAEKLPDLVTARMNRAERPGKVFLDWSQNNAAKTTITPYSLRGRAQAMVAWPRAWSEIERGAWRSGELRQVTLAAALGFLAEGFQDPLDDAGSPNS